MRLYNAVSRLVDPSLKGPVLRQLLRDAIHLNENELKDIIGMSLPPKELDPSTTQLALKLSQVTRGWSTTEELTEAVKRLSRRDLVTFVMTMLET